MPAYKELIRVILAQRVNTLSGTAMTMVLQLNGNLLVMDKTWEFFLIDPAKPTGIEGRMSLQYQNICVNHQPIKLMYRG